MGVYHNNILPSLLNSKFTRRWLLPEEDLLFVFDRWRTEQMTLNTSTGQKRLASYTCPYSGQVFAQSDVQKMPHVLENGQVYFNAGQFLVNTDREFFKRLHTAGERGVYARFWSRQNPGTTLGYGLIGNNSATSSQVGVYMMHDNRTNEQAINNLISRGGTTYRYNHSLYEEAKNRFGFDRWQVTLLETRLDGTNHLHRSGTHEWYAPEIAGNAFATTVASQDLTLGSIGGAFSHYGSIDCFAFYAKPKATVPALLMQQYPSDIAQI